MANTTGEAWAIGVPVLIELDQLSDWTWIAHGSVHAKPFGLAMEKELVTVVEKKHEQNNESQARSSQRWRALDHLLHVSFALISPAYLFNSFPPLR